VCRNDECDSSHTYFRHIAGSSKVQLSRSTNPVKCKSEALKVHYGDKVTMRLVTPKGWRKGGNGKREGVRRIVNLSPAAFPRAVEVLGLLRDVAPALGLVAAGSVGASKDD
jgi:hypothetical protein